MSRNDTEMQEALDLDQRWDELNAGNPAVRRLDRGDQELRELVALDALASPRPEFVAGLMGRLRAEARQIGPVEQPAVVKPIPVLEPVRPARRMRRMRGLSGAGKVASVLLAASLLFGMMAALIRYPFTSTDGTGGPTVVAPGPQIPDVPMHGANPARTNVQPGPGLTMLPEIKQKADIVGTSMALADNVLVILIYGKVLALDANTLTELWSKDLDRGSYSAPTIAGGTIYFGYTFDVEGRPDRQDNDQLVALALADGHELWRVTGAGVFPASPIAVDGVVYALGGSSQQYNVGAYQAADGKQLWRTDVAARGYCCPDMGIALANGKLAVSLSDNIAEGPNPHTVGVYDAANGVKLWLATDSTAATVGEPVIVDGLLIINEAKEELFGTQTQQEMKTTSGATVAYDLATGAVRWSNESTRTHRLPVASVPERNASLYVGPWEDSDGGQLALLSLENGQPIWNETLPHVLDDPNVYSPSDVPPVVVGDTAYVVGSTQMLAGGNVRSSLLSAVDLATGKTRWMAQIDGGIVETPIVAGGKVFVLTIDAGLSVLGESITAAATPATATEAAVIDLRTPVVCNAAPSDSPMLGDLPATPTIPEVAPWHQSILFSSIPSGVATNVDATTAKQLEDLFNAYRACSAVDPYHGVFGFFSTDFYVRLKSVQEYWGEPDQPWAVWMAASFVYLKLDSSSLQMLPDGRIGGLINGPTTNFYAWFVQENGAWKIDEYHPIAPDPVTPTTGTPVPSTNPEGTPEAESGSGWPFGAGGSGDFTIPACPDPLRIRLVRAELPSGASMTILPSAFNGIAIAQGTASITNPAQDGTWAALPPGSGASLASDVATTVANHSEAPVTIRMLVVGTGDAFADATGGAEIVTLFDVGIDPLPAGPARYYYEGLKATPNVPVIVDTSRDGVALLIVDDGTFAVVRDGGKWALGRAGTSNASEPIPAVGKADLTSGDFALVTSGAAFHGSAANGGELTYFLLTIEVNSAVVQQVESGTAESDTPPPCGTNGPDGTPSVEAD